MADAIAVPEGQTPLIRVASRSGRVDVQASAVNLIAIEGGGRLEAGTQPGEFTAAANRPSDRLILRCPQGSDLIIGTSSGGVELHGRLGNVRVTTASGDIRLEAASRADLRLGSGKAEVKGCDWLRVHAASGGVSIGSCTDVQVAAASGKVEVADASRIRVRAGSGDVSVTVKGDAVIETMSGKVRVAVADGLRPAVRARSLRGRQKNEGPRGATVRSPCRRLAATSRWCRHDRRGASDAGRDRVHGHRRLHRVHGPAR